MVHGTWRQNSYEFQVLNYELEKVADSSKLIGKISRDSLQANTLAPP